MCCGRDNVKANTEPYTFKLPDGTSKTVSSKTEERAERDKYFVRERAKARQAGYTVTR